MIKRDSSLHQMLVEQISDRLLLSSREMEHYHPQWDRAEECFVAYLPTTEDDRIRKSKRDNEGKPQYTTIKIPYSYAALMTAHTYYSTIFMGRDPIFQMQGRHGEAQTAEQCVEALLAYQMSVGQNMVPLYIWLLDVGKYGLGVIGRTWHEEIITTSSWVEGPRMALGVPIPFSTKKRLEVQQVPGYVGNKLFNIRPYDWYPDPRKPIWKFQEGEFCGRYVELSWHEFEQGVRDGVYFNREEILNTRPGIETAGQLFRSRGSSKVGKLPNENGFAQIYGGKTGEVDPPLIIPCYEFFWKIVPNQFPGLKSNVDVPEMWVFTLAAGDLIIGAQPTGELSGRFPFEAMEYEPDGYNLVPRGMLETITPLNDVLDWLINTHFYNVRATLNNQLIVDPSMLVMKDFEQSGPGKLIRLKPAAYGRDTRLAVNQLAVSDVTRTHIADTSIIMDLLQRVPGVTDNIQGMMPEGGRITATQSRISTSFGVNRLKTNSEFFSAMGFAPLAQGLLQSTQQSYDLERQYRIVGDLAQYGEKYLHVGPMDIAGFFDFVAVDGTMPIDRYAMATLWQGLLAQVAQFPQIMASWDIPKIFGYVASLGGIKNLNSFKIQVVPDEIMEQEEQAGNVVPMKTPMPGAPTVQPAQNMGMGPTG